MTNPRAKRVTVVGGGFSGAVFAHHLLRASRVPVVIDIVEDRVRLGAGVAYSASAPHQTTNIPTQRMSVYADDPTHFERWLLARGNTGESRFEHSPNRFDFGTYMDELVHGTEPAHPGSALQHRRGRVSAIVRNDGRLDVREEGAATWPADAVALATGNPVPLPPRALIAVASDRRVVLDPWAGNALDAVRPHDRVLILGTGLSMGETVTGLRAAGHRGGLVAIARRGRRPERGMIQSAQPFGNFETHRPKTAVALLRHFRDETRRAEAAGLSWRSVAVGARTHGREIWASLPTSEQKRFVRHLKPFWEALRHVMPGPVHDLLAKEERSGRLQVWAASLRTLEALPDGLRATLHRRGTAPGQVVHERFDAVLNCTGPAYATLTETDPFWAALARARLVRPDQVGLGIAVDDFGRALDQDGSPQNDLLVLGTLARGTFGELTGIVELSRQAREAAEALVKSWDGAQAPAELLSLEQIA